MSLLSRREFLRLLGALPLVGTVLPGAARAGSALSFTVNDRPLTIDVSGAVKLVDLLRFDLGLTGTKSACGRGVCGACTVLVNGRPFRACEVDVRHVGGLSIRTIEGLSGEGQLEPVQKTFADLGVFQCGYCAPGIVLVASSLLAQNPSPGDRQIREALEGNVCRCTGYQRIVEAVRAVHDDDLRKKLLARGCSAHCPVPDILAREKVTGRLTYAGDVAGSPCLHGRLVFSPLPRARIRAVETGAALAMPGVRRVLTHSDVPGRNVYGSIIPDRPVLAGEETRCLADVVAVVLADTPAHAGEAASRVVVRCDPLPALFDHETALAPGAPQLTPKGNVCWASQQSKGSVDQGRRRARWVVRQTYRTPRVEHGYLEPESCLARIDSDGALVVIGPSQGPHSCRDNIAAICGLKPERIHFETTVAGGGFGARSELTIQQYCALGALLTGNAVRIDLTREETVQVNVKRHPFTLDYETGIDEKGLLTHCVARGIADAGAYHSATLAVIENAATFATGPYQIDHVEVEMKGVFTNNPVAGAMRGFGVPQVCLAMERQVDELARKAGLDPLQVRLRNALAPGRVTQWGEILGEGVGIGACLEALERATRDAKKGVVAAAGERIGLGFAACYKNASAPTHLPIGQADVTLRLGEDGRVEASVGGCELGQGLVTVVAALASRELRIPMDLVSVVCGSTRRTASPTMTSASQQTFLTGNAILAACPKFRDRVREVAARLWKVAAASLDLGAGGVVSAGKVVATYREVAARARLMGETLEVTHTHKPPVATQDPPRRVESPRRDLHILPSLGYCAQAALVRVNTATGEVTVERIVAALDAGRVINGHAVEGQIHGGVAMGLGWCFGERLDVDRGRILNPNLDAYHVPRCSDVPPIEAILVEVPEPLGPHGARGIGELPIVPTAPAVLNAIRDATGIGLCRLPVTPADVLQRRGKGGS